MMRIIDKNLDKIRALCNQHKVSKLFVFGSVLTDKFKTSGDIDFLVDFAGVDFYDYADNYFDLKTSLEQLLKRQIDLLEDKAVKNPYLRKSIDSSKQMIYGISPMPAAWAGDGFSPRALLNRACKKCKQNIDYVR